MIDKKQIKDVFKNIFSFSTADQTEAVIFSGKEYLTRFANSIIHQNVATDNAQLVLRTVIGKKVLVSNTNDLHKDRLKQFVQDAVQMTKNQPEDPDFHSLPEKVRNFDAEVYVKSTANLTAADRAQKVKHAVEIAAGKDAKLAGILSNEESIIAVANTLGVESYYHYTAANFSVTAMKPAGTGYGNAYSLDIDEIDIPTLTATAVNKAVMNCDAKPLEPGKYTVILEPGATSNMLLYLIWIGFGGAAFYEKRSFLADSLGKMVANEKISLIEDFSHPALKGMPFDFEGYPKQRVELINKGVAGGPVWDSYYSRKAKTKNTGHAIPGGGAEGPFPMDIVMTGGDSNYEEMISSVDKGILVTRFWYNQVVDFKKTIITGMTRDGTFLIENGRITAALKNLRFNQNILEALKNTTMLSKEQVVQAEGFFKFYVPIIRVENFNITGASTF